MNRRIATLAFGLAGALAFSMPGAAFALSPWYMTDKAAEAACFGQARAYGGSSMLDSNTPQGWVLSTLKGDNSLQKEQFTLNWC